MVVMRVDGSEFHWAVMTVVWKVVKMVAWMGKLLVE
jgi:hypothetical protein